MPSSKSPSSALTSGRGRATAAKKPAPRAPKGQPSHEVRIIGGQWRRTRLKVLDKPGLRPTPDRVRETLFNWLGQDLRGLRCLDAFAGSGALGFEAASRGAVEVLMLELDPGLATHLRSQAQRLQASQVRVQTGDALAGLRQASAGAWDVVFLDPPFGDAAQGGRASSSTMGAVSSMTTVVDGRVVSRPKASPCRKSNIEA